jgi:hypothetical protein
MYVSSNAVMYPSYGYVAAALRKKAQKTLALKLI